MTEVGNSLSFFGENSRKMAFLREISYLRHKRKEVVAISLIVGKSLNFNIRRLIYTTNTVEGYHRQVRKVTKTKGVFTSDDSLIKLVYLAYRNIRKKWTMPLANWSLIAQQLCIRFENRFKIL